MFLVFETDYFAFLDAFEMCEKWMFCGFWPLALDRSGLETQWLAPNHVGTCWFWWPV